MKYIIMAGGSYPKFKIPKQLLKINGEVIIERTIRLLRENGITDIAVSTNDERFNYLDVELLHDKSNEFLYWGEKENKASNSSWLKAYYPVQEPVCYLHGDVYFSDEAIRTIVNAKVKNTMFFCAPGRQDVPHKDVRNAGGREPLAYKVENYKLFREAIDDLLRMIDEGKFSKAVNAPIAWTAYRYLNGLDLVFEAQNFGDLNDIFNSKGDYIIINDYTNDVDDEKDIAKIEKYLKFEEGKMIRVEVIEGFTLRDFNKLENVTRKSIDKPGELFIGDTFECDEAMVEYLSGANPYKKPYVKVIEVLPTKKEPKIIETIETPDGTFGYGPVEIKETKPKKKKASKK